jgi:hypothetical protein
MIFSRARVTLHFATERLKGSSDLGFLRMPSASTTSIRLDTIAPQVTAVPIGLSLVGSNAPRLVVREQLGD